MGSGEDSICWDEAKNRYVGVVSLGYSSSGMRVRKKVMGRTKTEVRESSRSCILRSKAGVRPRRHYAVNDALDDWLATGLDGSGQVRALGRESLTATERVVSLLVAHGLTNGAVAQRLYIWPHIVNTHLRHVFAKLGVPGRVALAAVVHHSIE